MTKEEIRGLLGLFAFDIGTLQSGVIDVTLVQRLKAKLEPIPAAERHALLSRIAREEFLSDEAIKLGYGLRAARDFAQWLDETGLW